MLLIQEYKKEPIKLRPETPKVGIEKPIKLQNEDNNYIDHMLLKSIKNEKKNINPIINNIERQNSFIRNKSETNLNRSKSVHDVSNIVSNIITPPILENKKDSILSEYLDGLAEIQSIKPLKVNNRILSARIQKPLSNQFRPNTASMNKIQDKNFMKFKQNRPFTAMNKNNNVINININFYNIEVKEDKLINPTPVKNLLYMNKNEEFMNFNKEIKSRPQTGKFNLFADKAKKSNFVFKELLKNMEVRTPNKLTINDLKL